MSRGSVRILEASHSVVAGVVLSFIEVEAAEPDWEWLEWARDCRSMTCFTSQEPSSGNHPQSLNIPFLKLEKHKTMSTASKVTLVGTLLGTAGIVAFVHWAQTAEKAVCSI
jgi:hypothetical protein